MEKGKKMKGEPTSKVRGSGAAGEGKETEREDGT